MKKYRQILILLITLFSISTNAQEWKQEYPVPTNFELNDLHFSDSTRGWLVGANGTILVSDDGGDHWANQIVPTTSTLYGVTFIDAQEGWVVGEGSTILHTTDAGNTWQSQSATANLLLKKVQFVDAQYGWAMTNADIILRTTDGGNTWLPFTVATSLHVKDLVFIDANNGWIASDTSVWKTIDGGQNWIEQLVGSNNILHAIDFVDANHGWATGIMGATYRTLDGGDTWNRYDVVIANGYSIIDVHFFDSLYGVCVREGYGLLLETRDGGVHWNFLAGGIGKQTFFLDSTYAWSMGEYNSSVKLSRSQDGAQNWTNLYQNSTDPFEDVCAINNNEAWAVGKAGVLYSSDIGKTWQPKGSGISTPCYEIEFADNGQDGWMITTWLRIYKTIDGGSTWTRSQSLGNGIITEHLYELDFIDNQIGWVGSSYGTIYKTIDAGLNWQSVASGFFSTKVLQFATDQKGWMADAANIYRTLDGGDAWGIDTNFVDKKLQDLFFLDSLHGWGVGNDLSFNTLLFKTNNGGNSWTIDTLPSALPKRITFADPFQGWLADVNGNIWYSQNGGQTWSLQHDGTVAKVNALAAADSAHCWAVGNKSAILRYQDCTINTPLISESTGTLSTGIYQNYQWLLNGLPIAGATQQTYTPTTSGVYTVLVENGQNCTVRSLGFVMDESVFSSNNRIELKSLNFIELYPNPSRGYFSIQFGEIVEPIQIRLVNLSGQLLATYATSGREEQMNLDLSNYVNGMYLLQFIRKNGGMEVQKIIIQK